MKLKDIVINRVLGTADPKFGLMSFPELVASAYFLWDLKDRNKQAAYLYEKLIPILRTRTLDYAWKAILREMNSCINQVSYAIIPYENLYERCPYMEGSPKYENCLARNNIHEFDGLFFEMGELHGGEIELRGDYPDEDFEEVTRWFNVGNDYVSTRKPDYPKFDFKSAKTFFGNFAPDSLYGGEGWLKITKTADKLMHANSPSNVMRLFDKLIHIQHYTGNVFSKCDFAPELDRVIELKAKNPKLLVKYLPKGPVRQLAARKGVDVSRISDRVQMLKPETALLKWLKIITVYRLKRPNERPIKLLKRLTQYVGNKYLSRRTYTLIEKRLNRMVGSRVITKITADAILNAINPVGGNSKQTVDYVTQLLTKSLRYQVPEILEELFPRITTNYGKALWSGIVPKEVFKSATKRISK